MLKNIMEPDGRKRLIIANSNLLPGPVIEGEEFPSSLRAGKDNAAGFIFINDDGNEMGGLVWGGKKINDKYIQQFYFSIDPYLQNEIVSFSVSDYNGERDIFLRFIDRPHDPEGFKKLIMNYGKYVELKDKDEESALNIKKEIDEYVKRYVDNKTWESQRMVISKKSDGYSGIKLYDKTGNLKLELAVSENGTPNVRFYDEKGEIVKEIK